MATHIAPREKNKERLKKFSSLIGAIFLTEKTLL
jgi:hypothetical protein